METGVYELAGHVVAFSTLHADVHQLCRHYKASEQPDGKAMREAEICFTTTQEQIDFERKQSAETDVQEGREPVPYPDGYLETLAVYRQLAEWLTEKQDTLLMHGSVVAVDGRAYMFCAPSGTGKTTHTIRWMRQFRERAIIVNGDKPLIHIPMEGDAIAYGTPWDGKEHWSHNMHAPLGGIAILERSADNHIERMRPIEAFTELLRFIHYRHDKASTQAAMALAARMVERVPIYRLGCNMEQEAAVVASDKMMA